MSGTPEFFEQAGTRGFYRPVGNVTFEQAVELMAAAMKHARALDLADLLVNSTGLTGMSRPSTFARYDMAVKWAESAGAALRVAMVARTDMIDPQKIGLLMAQNRGISGEVFDNEVDALRWLDDRYARSR